MNICYILIYLTALISVLIGIAGLIILVFGIANRKKKMTITGSILTFLSVLIIVSGVFWGMKKTVHYVKMKHYREMRYRMYNCFGDKRCMQADSLFNKEDSLLMSGDTGKICIERRICIDGKGVKCKSMRKCNPSECMKKCGGSKE